METKKTVKDISFKCATLTTERTCKLVNELLIKGFTLESPDPEPLIVVSNGKIDHNNSTEWFANHPAQEYIFEQAMKLVSEIEDQKCKLEIKYSDERNLFYVNPVFVEGVNVKLPTINEVHEFLEQEYTKIMFENGTLKNKLSYLNEPEPTKLKRGIKLLHYKSSNGQCQTKCPYRHDVGVASHACDVCSYQIDRYINLTMNQIVYGVVVCNHLDKD